MDNASWMVNTLIARLSPWYPIEFQLICDGFVLAKIGNYYCRVLNAEDESHRTLYCEFPDFNRTIQAKNFLNHLNGILAGKVRNDAGELVSA